MYIVFVIMKGKKQKKNKKGPLLPTLVGYSV